LRSFADLEALIGLVLAQVVTRLSAIDFGRGSEALYRDQMPGLLTEDGNGRVARLLTGAMLSGHGYTVGRYVSLEEAIAESDDANYQALLDSTHGGHDGAADPWPWLGYSTSVIADAYAVFADRAAAAQTAGTKQQRVPEHILRHAPATFRLADIRTALPGVSDQTIRLALEQLRNEGRVRADGTGRSATWTQTNTATFE
jgi:Fic family protein